MDRQDALDLARQLREHLNYQGDIQKFDEEIVELVTTIVNECAIVVEKTPVGVLLMGNPILMIAAAVRGYFKQ